MNVSTVDRRGGRRAAKNAATTAALLDAAARTFAQRGFAAATMDEIAERVGLSKGALYYRYKTKEDLFIALLDERCGAYIRQLHEAFGGGASQDAGWPAMAGRFLEVVQEENWPRLFFEFVSHASRSPRAKRELVKRIRAVRAALAGVIERQTREAGIELPISAELVALGISALCNGLAIERLADPRAVPDEAFVDVPALLMSGLATRTQGTTRTRAKPARGQPD